MREGPGAITSEPFTIGITPAYAGRTAIQYQRQRQEQDHPRLCGKDTY